MKEILIVEDESLVALEIESFVKSLGYEVLSTVSDAKECFKVIKKKKPDLILMDVYIKGDIDGIECSKKIKQNSFIPIIFISAFSDDETLNRAVLTNPSAYLIKPFNRKELEVAIKIALKKHNSYDKKGDIIFDEEFSFDTASNELIHNGEIIHLTKKELQLLKLFLNKKNTLVSYYDIENELWPDKESNENTRRSIISRLRSKLKYRFIQTEHSLGYKFKI